MICRSCLRQVWRLPQRPALLLSRPFATTFRARNAAPAAPDAPSLAAATAPDAGGDGAAADAPLSSCPKGTIMTGLNFYKNKTDPVAMADKDYPEWLWTCLEVKQKAAGDGDEAAGADEFSKSKKQRRAAAKRQRLLEAKMLASGDLSALAPKIPLQQQSINLPGGEDGSVEGAVLAAEKREELRQAMRRERKAKIKESNYLKSM
ncbi:hypothetical protein GGTG_10231 [Gaeumannomyces tritici R3-111a-1]|uniref:Large ribosomal subunit protein mL54 n=1 Tax=Gaeumannomyces tritici (strain R3-111a-1) TaxID=644352 RepID=J3P9Q4_GAET3|nr:hypothetical protein GGTG_10231 [Gaeumannomyces tritici R3-111a-1]EJT73390.1 hypothetical protein GGTG_10231 [Gaeumannomyces tritici R3-111a-1]